MRPFLNDKYLACVAFVKGVAHLPKSRLIPLGFLGCMVLWIFSGYVMRRVSGPVVSEDSSLLSVQVLDSTATLKEIKLRLQGQTKASSLVEVRAEGEGKIIFILDKGQKVEKNQPLARLQPEDREAHFAKVKAQYHQRVLEHQAAVRLGQQGFMPPNHVAKAQAWLGEAKANLETARCEVENATIKAPFSGILDDKKVSVGDYVLKGDKVLKLLDLDPIRAVGFVQEQDVHQIILGQEGFIKLKTGVHKGTVVFVSSSADPQTRMFQVELSAPNPEGKIPEGLTAEIEIPLEKIRAHFVSPAILTLQDEGTVGVKVVLPDNHVQFVPVQIVASETTGVWVKGLPETARIITVGQEFVMEGQKIAPVLQNREEQSAPKGFK